MNKYDRNVSDREFEQAAKPSIKELAIAAQALAMAMSTQVPIIECLSAVIEMTPNARLRRILSHVETQCHEGEDLASSFSHYGDLLDETFIVAVQDGESNGNLDVMLFEYAKERGLQPHQVAEQAGRSEAVQKFTAQLAEDLHRDVPALRALHSAVTQAHGPFREVMTEVADKVEGGSTLSEAIGCHPQVFDRLYADVVRGGEAHRKLARAFDLLAKS